MTKYKLICSNCGHVGYLYQAPSCDTMCSECGNFGGRVEYE